ncbi:MAG TPA: methylenetetrahydrofolate reductase, partial [Dehalococcoidales bacterium]|nr:methylenetetrahydrofolate reductase [Dehalococcoidales bacterium]
MKIGETIRAKKSSVSFEFFPPKEKAGEDKLIEGIKKLAKLNPTFVSVTCGAGGGSSRNTAPLVSRIKKETSLTVMPHQTCIDQTSTELKEILEGYKKAQVENVLALRGDPPAGTTEFKAIKGGFNHASELIALAKSLGFSIGMAVYPEKHCESP